ncbi:MAG TPA: winged helix-turn-helix domain-containing protein [Woeseiaceae bacterium]|nr:winged helix-turn-helix domain-containing protein [Woeseiaceae bacterium]
MDVPEGIRGYAFGDYRLDVARQSLYCRSADSWTPLTPRVFDTLLYLVEHPNNLLDKERMLAGIWPDVVVEENNLDQNISRLRHALGDRRGNQRYIVTVRGRGYRFVAPVRKIAASDPADGDEVSPTGKAAEAGDLPGDPRTVGRRVPLWGTAALAAIAVAIAIAAMFMLLRGSDQVQTTTTRQTPTLAVLPFRPLAGTDRNESLELGMAETLIMRLNSPRLAVSPLSSVRRYADPGQDAVIAGRALDVDAVLEGHLQRDGDRLRVSARLMNVDDGRQLWADRYDESFTDIFSVQDTIATKVWAALTPDLIGEVPPALRRYTEDAEAYELYVSGRFYRQRGNEAGLRQALELFQRAVDRDPDFALAYVGLADTYAILGVFGIVAPHDTFPEARQAVDKALELAPQLGEAYASLGHIKVQYEHDWAGAEQAYKRAIELNPNYAPARQMFGLYLSLSGRFDDGLEQMRNAQALEPSSPLSGAMVGMLLNYQRRYDEAIDQLIETVEMDPALPTARTYLAVSYLRRGEYELALDHLRQSSSLTPGSAAYLGQIYALSGRRKEAEAELERLIAESRHRYVPAFDIATIYAALGKTDETFAWLERAFDERSQLIGWVPWDPVFDGIRSDPRYPDVVRRLNIDIQDE